jgi:hypothetical protein
MYWFQQFLDENRRLKSENQGLKKDLLCAIDGQRKGNTSKDRNGKQCNPVQTTKFFLTSLLSLMYGQQVFLDKFTFPYVW